MNIIMTVIHLYIKFNLKFFFSACLMWVNLLILVYCIILIYLKQNDHILKVKFCMLLTKCVLYVYCFHHEILNKWFLSNFCFECSILVVFLSSCEEAISVLSWS